MLLDSAPINSYARKAFFRLPPSLAEGHKRNARVSTKQSTQVKAVAKPRKQKLCRICKKRPQWANKNCPPRVCKRCYHKHVWNERPAARKARQEAAEYPVVEVIFDGYSGQYIEVSEFFE